MTRIRGVTASRRLLITLLLPLLAVRMLVPAGFMPVVEGGELRLALCPQGMQFHGPGHADADHAGADHGGAHHGDTDDAPRADMGKCPFAGVAFAVPPAGFVVAVAMTAPNTLIRSTAAAEFPPSTGPPRATAARAPPRNC